VRRAVRAEIALAALALATTAWGEDRLLYYEKDGEIVFTNVPSRVDARPVPGFEKVTASFASVTLPATPWDEPIERIAVETGLSPSLIKAVAMVESGLDPKAVSPKGAQGLMQLMPATAAAYGVRDVFDPEENLRAGAIHLRGLLDEFNGDLTLALAAYNAGTGAVRRYNGVPAYRETRDYVHKVQRRLGKEDRSRSAPAPAATAAAAARIRAVQQSDGTVVFEND
jgi:soluble lytic murein transglycosylase-like protein